MKCPVVLLADDEIGFVETLTKRLRKRGVPVVTAHSGQETLENLVADSTIDVVVLDIKMPGMDGIATLKAIKRLHPLVEVILVTGHATVESAIEGMKLGAFDILMKPCETEELTVKIEKAHDRKAEQEDRIRTAKISHSASSPRSVLNDV